LGFSAAPWPGLAVPPAGQGQNGVKDDRKKQAAGRQNGKTKADKN